MCQYYKRNSFEWYASPTLAADKRRVQALIIMFNTFMVAMALSMPFPLIEGDVSHRDQNDITEEKDHFGYQFHSMAWSMDSRMKKDIFTCSTNRSKHPGLK